MRILFLPALGFTAAMLHGQAGALDPTFNPSDIGYGYGGGSSGISTMAVRSDGKLLIGTIQHARYNNRTADGLARVNVDGSSDTTFTSGEHGAQVDVLLSQPDGKVLVGGIFSTFQGVPRSNVARVLSDGSVDATFDTGAGANGQVGAMALRTDGKVLVVGSFTTFNGSPRNRIARLNADGSLDQSFNVLTGANGVITQVVAQPDGKVVVCGSFTSYDGIARNRIARLQQDGSLDNTFDPGTGANDVVSAMVLQPDGKLIIGGSFASYNGTVRPRLARVNDNGTLDVGFVSGVGPNSYVEEMLLEPDGKIIIAGPFSSYNGVARGGLARLNADASLDATYAVGSGAQQPGIWSLSRLTDGRLMVSGNFNTFHGLPRPGLVRLQIDGSLDQGFNAGSGASGISSFGSMYVSHISVLPDGRSLVTGSFRTYNGVPKKNLALLSTDGALDPSFDPGIGPNAVVRCAVVQPDGKFIIGGDFATINGVGRVRIARLLADGTLDPSFDPGTVLSGRVNEMVLLADGRLLVAGSFTGRIKRFLPNGALDTTFDPGTGANGEMHALMVQTDGKILIGGGFTSFNGTTRNRVARLLADGALDATFDPGSGASDVVRDIALQADGKIIVAGDFHWFLDDVTFKRGVVRLNSSGVLESGFNVSAPLNGAVHEVRVLTNGKFLIGGRFYDSYDFSGYHALERLTSFGEMDPTFEGPDSFPMLMNEEEGTVNTIALQGTDGVLIGGTFCAIDGIGRNRIARLRNVASTPLYINLSALLDGPYDAGTLLMGDQLRTAALLPASEPYTSHGYQHVGGGGGEVMQASALTIAGNDAIVDWVVVELRASLNAVWMSQSALLQRDGGVKGMDGLTNISFTTPPGPYYVAVRHRNHLGVLTATAIALSVSSPTLNFTSTATTTYGTAAQKQVGSKMVMWAGDATGNGQVRYTGAGNDRDPILLAVGSTTPNNAVGNVYDRRDTNLDGVIKYTGSANDRDIILTNVGSTTPNNTRTQQLP